LVLILGVLALMAVIGVTFATFSGQSRISARGFAQSVIQPQRDELMDFALAQLISDTSDIRSAIRGHSMARDMYGNDGNFNGYVAARPGGAGPSSPYNYYYLQIQSVTSLGGTLYSLTTNIPANDPAFYGYLFTRWLLRISYTPSSYVNDGAGTGTGVINQTLEILADSGYNVNNNVNRTFTVNIGSTEGNYSKTATPPTLPTTLVNPTPSAPLYPNGYVTQLPGEYLIDAAGGTLTGTCQFILDGRWLHAFNGPGMTTNAVHANFRYNGLNPNAVGMDEDYDAVDLENWFLAMQSADGSVIIPSFHRPAAIRYDPNGTAGTAINDWQSQTNDSMSRILRPRQFDGNDAITFPDLVPNAYGQITYDVDNDGDGVKDSIWLDLGYPARRNASGQLYKPLFAFMVIGLNGRIPLNSAGNLAGGGVLASGYHAAHLGNSVSEVDPTYGLQNGFVYAADATGAFTPQVLGGPYTAANTQVDNSGTTAPSALDVRMTQLRNILAGTRPQVNPGVPGQIAGTPDTTGQINGDDNFILMNEVPYFMPNGIADIGDVDGYGNTPPTAVLRLTPPVAGRWGESQSVPGYPKVTNPSPPPPYLNLVVPNYSNPIRAGYSENVGDIAAGIPRDAADDNLNSFDSYPQMSAALNRVGEVNDLDFLDPAGGFLLPVERMRRFIAPADINGTGRIRQWDAFHNKSGPDAGGDQWGRVEYYSYFRPPGLPGQVMPSSGATPNAVTFPYTNGEAYPTTLVTNAATPAPTPPSNSNPLHGFEAQRFPNMKYSGNWNPQHAGGVPIDQGQNPSPAPQYLPATLPTYDAKVNGTVHSDGLNEADEMNLYVPNAQLDSPFGYGDLEWLYRQQDVDGGSLSSRLAQLAPISFSNPIDGLRRRRLYALDTWDLNNFIWTNDNPGNVFPNNSSLSPSFTGSLTAGSNTVGVTAISSMLLLQPGQTVAGPPLASGLPTLPTGTTIVSVNQSTPTTGTITLSAAATGTGSEQLNILSQNASFAQLGVDQLNTTLPTPPLAHRDKKINLNYPLPISNDPNEPIRQKWISDTYQTLKAILPPRSVDTAEELAQLSQFVINIIDFRDTDATMTHWTNPDVYFRPGTGTNTTGTSPMVVLAASKLGTDLPLDQYGMEYNPIAINETMAYSFQNNAPPPAQVNRFFIELVNLLTSPELGTVTPSAPGLGTPVNNASVLDLAGFQSSGNATNPWNGGCWDLIFTGDDPASRPDPITGQLWGVGSTFYGLIPFCQAAFATSTDPAIYPLPQAPDVSYASISTPGTIPTTYFTGDPTLTPGPFPTSYFLTIGNTLKNPAWESKPFTPNLTLANAYDPVGGAPSGTPPPQGVLPPFNTAPTTSPGLIPAPSVSKGTANFYWVCLRRPANPFAAVSATNPMIVVDCMRFPYIESGGVGGTPPTPGNNHMYSAQRIQPLRGGHAVPVPSVTGAFDPRYGYTEQIADLTGDPGTGDFIQYGGNNFSIFPLYHTLGFANSGTLNPGSISTTTPPATIAPYLNEPWEYLPFNDRDFTSVAELLMVPGCPPGLFTKQFAEWAPSSLNVTNYFSVVSPQSSLPASGSANIPLPSYSAGTASAMFYSAGITTPTQPLTPHTFPYLVDKFFYTAASPTPPTPPATLPGPQFGDATGDGWYKMFEFFEVPSQMIGAIGPLAQGTDFDWMRQDTKPGLINPNLIIDEEVFFSVFGSQNTNFNQTLLNFAQLPPNAFPGASIVQSPATFNATSATLTTLPMGPVAGQSPSPIPLVVTATTANGSPAAAYPMNNVGVLAIDPVLNIGNQMKAAFAEFLSLRHGGSGYIFGYGSGQTGQNLSVLPTTPNPNGPTTPAQAMLSPIPADRPFHSLSYPDIDYTIIRPAPLPPSNYTDPQMATAPSIPPTTAQWPPGYTGTYTGDPGVRNTLLYEGFPTNLSATPAGSVPQSTPAATGAGTTPFLLPPPIPVRRLFQPPDAIPNPATNPVSNAGDTGDPYVNNLVPATASSAIGALPPIANSAATNSVVNLCWSAGATLPTVPTSVTSPYLGVDGLAAVNGSVPPPTPPSTAAVPPQFDMKQHPYFRTELLQKAMNLTTVRTHQYAVWITVGFFEVSRQGDLLMANSTTPWLAYDTLGPEVVGASGQTARYRGFFLVDRLQLTGYDPNVVGSFRPAVVYRQMIE